MSLFGVAKAAGRLTIGALRHIAGGVSSFAKGAAENAKAGNTEDEQKLAALVRMREMFVRTFGHLPWYMLLALAIGFLVIGLNAAGIEIINLQSLLESMATEAEKSVRYFGISIQLAMAALVLVAESAFGFVLFAAKYSIPFSLRVGISITAWSMAVIIIAGNFTTLQKRDIMAKRAAENQHQIVDLAKKSQLLTERAMASTEKAVTATEKNGATSATRAGAVAAANAADAAREQAIMMRQVADQLKKTPPPSSAEVQGEFWSRVLKMLGAVTMFAIQAFSMRLAGLFSLMSRHEYVAGRKEVDGAPNMKLPDFSKRKPLPDAPPPAPKLAPASHPEPALPPYPPESRLRLGEAGRVGSGAKKATQKLEPEPSEEPFHVKPTLPPLGGDGDPEPGRNRVGTGPEPEPADVPRETGDAEAIPEPVQPRNRSRLEPGGRLVIGDSVLADRRVEPVLRALILSDITEVSYSTANEALKTTGVRPAGMGKPALLAALAHLEACELLTPAGPGGRRAPSKGLLAARQSGAHIDDVVGVLIG